MSEQIEAWDSVGVRAVQVNLALTEMTHPLMSSKILLPNFLPELGVHAVFDHYGEPVLPEPTNPPSSNDPYDNNGFDALVRLLRTGTTWVRISGAYHFSHVDSEVWENIGPMTLELFAQASRPVIFESDWPCTRSNGLEIKPWASHLLDLTEGKQVLRNNLFRDNALELWGVMQRGCSARI